MTGDIPRWLSAVVLVLSVYSVLKFLFFFAFRYPRRRRMLDKSYGGRPYATKSVDNILLGLVAALAVLLLFFDGRPTSFLGGMFVGATLIQLFFHEFRSPVAPERAAPKPRSPIKQMSYAIQDRPGRAWKEMTVYAVIILAGIFAYFW